MPESKRTKGSHDRLIENYLCVELAQRYQGLLKKHVKQESAWWPSMDKVESSKVRALLHRHNLFEALKKINDCSLSIDEFEKRIDFEFDHLLNTGLTSHALKCTYLFGRTGSAPIESMLERLNVQGQQTEFLEHAKRFRMLSDRNVVQALEYLKSKNEDTYWTYHLRFLKRFEQDSLRSFDGFGPREILLERDSLNSKKLCYATLNSEKVIHSAHELNELQLAEPYFDLQMWQRAVDRSFPAHDLARELVVRYLRQHDVHCHTMRYVDLLIEGWKGFIEIKSCLNLADEVEQISHGVSQLREISYRYRINKTFLAIVLDKAPFSKWIALNLKSREDIGLFWVHGDTLFQLEPSGQTIPAQIDL